MPDIKTWGGIALALALLVGAGLVGQKIGHWQGQAEAATKASEDATLILSLSGSNAQLLLGIAAQNAAVAVAEAQAESAKATTKLAEAYAADMAKLSESRMNKIEKALKDAKTVGEVLSRYWELRQ